MNKRVLFFIVGFIVFGFLIFYFYYIIRLAPCSKHWGQGDTLYKSGNYNEAVREYKEALRLIPKIVRKDLYYRLAAAYVQLKQYDDAIVAYQQVIDIMPNDVVAYRALGGAYGMKAHEAKAAGKSDRDLWLKSCECFEKVKKINSSQIGKVEQQTLDYCESLDKR